VGSPLPYIPDTLGYADYVANNSLDYFKWSSLYSYAFETESTSLGVVTSPISLLVLIGLVLVLRSVKSVLIPYFSSLGRRAGRHTHGLEWEKHNEIRIVKFGEYVFRLLYHSLISILGVWYFSDKPWWNDDQGGTINLFLNFPNHPIAPGMAWYYLIQSAYNIEAMLSLLELSFSLYNKFPYIQWSPNVRGDFREMFVHHLVTNALVIGSSWLRFARIGSMVFLVHDISDIPVDLSKLANFLKWKKATAACFATMVIMWMLLRLGILPFVIFRSVLFESHLVLVTISAPVKMYVAYRSMFVWLLSAIIFLHFAWFVMFLQMGYILIFKGEAHDLSEHKKGEDQNLVPGKVNGTANGIVNGNHRKNE
jgi:ceramide synthetase